MMPQKGPHFEALKTAHILRTDSHRKSAADQFASSRGVCFAYFMNVKDAPLIITTFSAWKSASRHF